MARSPKRRRDKYNPYYIYEEKGHYYVVFKDGHGICIFREICASVPKERSAIPLETEQRSVC